MSNYKYNTSDIMDYLENELDDTKRKSFEQQMQKDPELNSEVETHRKLRAQLREEAALYNMVNSVYEDRNPTPKQQPKRSIIRRLLPFAAAAVLIPLCFFIYTISFVTYTPQEVYAQNFSTSVEAPTDRGSLTDAYDAYNENDYKGAITYFEKTENKKSIDKLLMGISYAKIKQYDNALSQLTPLSKKIDEYPNEAIQAQWEIIGIHLAQGNTEQALTYAKEYTENIPENNQHKNTKRLLRQLSKIKK